MESIGHTDYIPCSSMDHSQSNEEDENECISSDENPCQADLSLAIMMHDTIVLGWGGATTFMSVNVTNNGPNHAHDTKFFISLPIGMNFVSLTTYAQPIADPITHNADQNSSDPSAYMLQFNIRNSLPKNHCVFFEVHLSYTPKEKSLEKCHFSMKVNSTTADSFHDNNLFEKDVDPVVGMELSLYGHFNTETIMYKMSDYVAMEKVSNESQIGPEVEFQYYFHNTGPTPIDEVVFYFLWPNKTVDGDSLLHYSVVESETTPNVHCGSPIDVAEFIVHFDGASTENILGNVTAVEMPSITPSTDSSQLIDAELKGFLSCPHDQCGLIRCTINHLVPHPFEFIIARMRIAAEGMKSVRNVLQLIVKINDGHWPV